MGSDVGGLVGFSSGTISACYATGNATGNVPYPYSSSAGGLVGWNDGAISACYATGDASGPIHIGGLVGRNNGGTISACYATGNATGTDDFVRGLVGANGGGIITNSYFDSDASNRPASDDYAKTTTELQTPTAYGTSTDIYIYIPASGPVGETVMITGTGFSATATDNTVVFLGAEGDDADNVMATVSAATATSLTVSVPTDAQTGKISVMVSGQTGTSNTDFTVRTIPPSAPTSLTAVAAGFDQIDLRWTAPTNTGESPHYRLSTSSFRGRHHLHRPAQNEWYYAEL